jgi:hypothetical protein
MTFFVNRLSTSLNTPTEDCAMKTIVAAIAIAAAMLGSSAYAQKMNSDDLKWVNKCIDDNKGGAADAVIRKYCMCMNA